MQKSYCYSYNDANIYILYLLIITENPVNNAVKIIVHKFPNT